MSQNFTRFGLYYVKSLPDGSRTVMSLNCVEGLLTFVTFITENGDSLAFRINTISAGLLGEYFEAFLS